VSIPVRFAAILTLALGLTGQSTRPVPPLGAIHASRVSDFDNIPWGVNAGGFVSTGGEALFTACGAYYGCQLWRTTGTARGTHILLLRRGAVDGDLVGVGKLAVFWRVTPEQGLGLWRSDGTGAGTVMIKRFSNATSGWSLSDFTPVARRVYFVANEGAGHHSLWTTDGTPGGTRMAGPIPQPQSNLIADEQAVFFSAPDANGGVRIWKSNGTTAGTAPVAGNYPSPAEVTAVAGNLFFVGRGSKESQLWVMNARSGETRVVKVFPSKIAPVTAPEDLTAAGDELFFDYTPCANILRCDVAAGIWRSDGTTAGATLLKTSSVPPAFEADGTVQDITFVGRQVDGRPLVLFSMTGGRYGDELWRSHGTRAGTRLVTTDDRGRPTEPHGPGDITPFTVNDQAGALFVAGEGLWKTDGTAAGTVLLKTIGPYGPTPWGDPGGLSDLTPVMVRGHARVMFSAPGYVAEPWISDGTAGGTRQIVSIPSTGGPSVFNGSDFVPAGQRLFFDYTDDIWYEGYDEEAVSDGSARGTGIIGGECDPHATFDVIPAAPDVYVLAGGPSVSQYDLCVFRGDQMSSNFLQTVDSVTGCCGSLGDRAAFAVNGNQLWLANPSGPATLVTSLMHVGSDFATFHHELYFQGDDGRHGLQLWMTNGSPGNATMVTDLVNGSASSNPAQLVPTSIGLFFMTTGPKSQILWAITNGARRPKQLLALPDDASVQFLKIVNRRLFFVLKNAAGASELWRTDGTKHETQKLYGYRGAFGTYAEVGNRLFYAIDGSSGTDLWVTGGEKYNTSFVKHLGSRSNSVRLTELVSFEDRLFFIAQDTPQHMSLWTSDGTGWGTMLIRDLGIAPPGQGYPDPSSDLTAFDGHLFFGAYDDSHGNQLWTSNGTRAGTRLWKVICREWCSSYPDHFMHVGNQVFFTAYDPLHGDQLWVLKAS
jgi:ELWxxDGT repeat protein